MVPRFAEFVPDGLVTNQQPTWSSIVICVGLGHQLQSNLKPRESGCFWRESSASSQDSTLFHRVQHVLTQLLLHWVDDFVMLISPPKLAVVVRVSASDHLGQAQMVLPHCIQAIEKNGRGDWI